MLFPALISADLPIQVSTGFSEFFRLFLHAVFERGIVGQLLFSGILSNVLSNFHGAKMRAAHGAKMRQFGPLSGERGIMKIFGRFRIKG
jgi:hypothetical protein